MSTPFVSPSSVEGIKRLAKSIKRELGIPHMQALDAAARRAGYQNIQHAKNTLSGFEKRHLVYVTAYWRVPNTGDEGRETMTLRFGRPLNELLAGASFYFGFRVDASDHLEGGMDHFEQEETRENILRVIRHLQFADATGLAPWKHQSIRAFHWESELPKKDHSSMWEDPGSGAPIYADEPYQYPGYLMPLRQAWAVEHGLAVAAPPWDGMYIPRSSTLYLTCRREHAEILERVTSALASAPAPVVQWSGDSAPYHPTFVSPLRLASGKSKKPRGKRRIPGTVRAGAILVGSLPDSRWWRPNAQMPVHAHRSAAVVIDAAMAWVGNARHDTYRRQVRHIRDHLDAWLTQEHPGRLPNGFDREMYYGRRDGVLDQPPDIEPLRNLVIEHYPDCAPRRMLLKKIDTAMQIVAKKIALRPVRK
jgi:hypothetical protein